MTYEQICEKDGVTIAAIKKRLQRAALANPGENFTTTFQPGDEIPENILSVLQKRSASGPKPVAEPLIDHQPEPGHNGTLTQAKAPRPRQQKAAAQEKPVSSARSFLSSVTLSAVLPVMGIPAAYGVYQYVSYFSPGWVSAVYCTGFELVYISVSLQRDLTADTLRKAQALSIAAFLLSVIYNVFADIIRVEFGGNIMNCDYWLRILLYILHGAAAPIISYYYAVIMISR